MIVNKKFDRLKQWGRERMGGEVKTDTSDEFKNLEVEMQLRQDGMERMQRSTNAYVKSISKRDQGDEKEKQLPIAFMGSTMISHGDDFEPDSEFGQCLALFGRANERIARMQETYCSNATSSWLESTERSLIQMKEYQAARKKLQQRRLAFDTASTKMQKSKKEDFRVEEELRSQKAKYEESSEDVYRRMLDIKEAEVDSVQDLSSFLEAELAYYDRCREVLMQVKRDWPAQQMASNRSDRSGAASPAPSTGLMRRQTRSRGNSVTSYGRYDDEPLEPPVRPTISSRVPSGQSSPRHELPGMNIPIRPQANRAASGFEGPTSFNRANAPSSLPPLTRIPTDSSKITSGGRNGSQHAKRDTPTDADLFGDESSDYFDSSAQMSHSGYQRTANWANNGNADNVTTKKAPPPPPPSRTKKPPPPPPLKRSALSTSEVPQY
ncbi:Hypothetical protein R9X50_00353400 [Acrodontium crateriforme]|uniref:BAR domain-containing protein n=1 Tax=Acrodontium crateriforme TaxID=150365 RepID=A0AAQ3R7J2_9PEZI|nr:Hypothetical protein R9X50_00353400 [Acrodontium crateriforme]